MEFRGRVNVDLNGAWAAQLVERGTQQVAARARASARVDSGNLLASISSRVERNSGVKRDRVVGFVTAAPRAEDGSGYGASAEFGNSRERGSFFLRRALSG